MEGTKQTLENILKQNFICTYKTISQKDNVVLDMGHVTHGYPLNPGL